MRHIRRGQWLGLIGAVGVILVGVTLGVMWQAGVRFPWAWLLLVIFSGIVLAAAWAARPRRVGRTRWNLIWYGTILAALGVVMILIYALTAATAAAWGTMVFAFAVFLNLDEVLAASFENMRPVPRATRLGRAVKIRSTLTRWIIHIILALACGGLTASIAQIESHFSDEEFFVALQVLVLAGFWLLLRGVLAWLWVRFSRKPLPETENREETNGKTSHQIGFYFDSRWVALIGLITITAFSIFTIHSYQRSFYPTQAPPYPGISAENPFLCGKAAPDLQTYDGHSTFLRLLALVKTNPNKTTPEYGMLALGSRESRWTQTFHDSLLDEAHRGLFTGPTGSVKSVQYDAALRVYYYNQARAAFPSLFTPAQDYIIRQWFAAINRRALTVEPVDWMYALAFTKWPEGPYENQDSGVGLLALLEKTGLADPALSVRNRAYLGANQRGWVTNFRVTDDAAVYQPVWLDNAYFQSLYTGDAPPENLQSSFEWLLLQALPDGMPLKYNHTGSASLDGIAYLGAELIGNDSYLWLAGRTVDYLESQGMYAGAQPGLETESDLVGHSPTQGSCLLYGDSGLPNQIGPLAPDKIVFRDGWSPDSTYLLLNLRFSGWHRYKATNTITLVYQSGLLSGDLLSGETFSWLPIGRSLFRDKRIPRENLNGLVIARTGMSAVVSTLTGIGGAWAQDPPYYASVENFVTGPEMDTSTTVLSGWRGWTQRRTIFFYHDGPIVIVDGARGPDASPAAFVWNLPIGASVEGERVTLRGGDSPAEMVLVPIFGNINPTEDGIQFQASGRLALVTVFLTREWVGAKVNLISGSLQITRENQQITLPMPEEIP